MSWTADRTCSDSILQPPYNNIGPLSRPSGHVVLGRYDNIRSSNVVVSVGGGLLIRTRSGGGRRSDHVAFDTDTPGKIIMWRERVRIVTKPIGLLSDVWNGRPPPPVHLLGCFSERNCGRPDRARPVRENQQVTGPPPPPRLRSLHGSGVRLLPSRTPYTWVCVITV